MKINRFESRLLIAKTNYSVPVFRSKITSIAGGFGIVILLRKLFKIQNLPIPILFRVGVIGFYGERLVI